ncbi:MAG: XRE family transcriptional regulator [Prevotella sp.]|nr:XRE family transcriptional regulator [Prevotella sp.]
MANEKEKKSIHIGSVIKEELNRQGRTTVWLAEQLGCHRTNLYKIYDRRTIDTGVLLRISRIMGYDFFQLYSANLAGNVV